jgi:hypothetical protein
MVSSLEGPGTKNITAMNKRNYRTSGSGIAENDDLWWLNWRSLLMDLRIATEKLY